MKRNGLHIFVVGHNAEMLSTVPHGDDLEAVDLRALTLPSRFQGNAFAESRFLVSAEARHVPAEYVGFCSANYDKKFPRPPHLDALPRLAAHLRPDDGVGPGLSSRWLSAIDDSNPGMATVLQRVATHFGLRVRPKPVPYNNTFVCHRDEWLRLLDAFESMLTAVLDWYGPTPPFRYRCLRCGFVSDTGHGRYTNERHIAYLAERITMLHFASRPDIQFVTPTALRLRTSRLLRSRAKLHTTMKRRGIHVPRPNPAPWDTSSDGPACPGCEDLALEHGSRRR
jgi:hypothetical protein